MSGRVLLKLIQDERAGKFDGDDVQIIPHLTGAIQDCIIKRGEGYDVHIVEIGGTVGDYESLSVHRSHPRAGRQRGPRKLPYVHVVYLPYLGASNETKTKPAQNSVRELRGLGIAPDILVGRSEQPASGCVKQTKLVQRCAGEAIALLPNARSIYEVPLTLEDTGIADVITQRLGLKASKTEPQRLARRGQASHYRSRTHRQSRFRSQIHGQHRHLHVGLRSAQSLPPGTTTAQLTSPGSTPTKFDGTSTTLLKRYKPYDGIVVPGGFGQRGLEGKIKAAQYALTPKVPYLGLCLGLQMAVIAAARNVGGSGQLLSS